MTTPRLARRVPGWALVGLVLWLVAALAAGFAAHAPADVRPGGVFAPLAAPSATHWLGTDAVGRDVLSRLLHGARLALVLGGGAALIVALLGTALGVLATRLAAVRALLGLVGDAVGALPALVVVILARGLLGGGAGTLVGLIAAWPALALARVVHAVLVAELAMPYAEAARALGLGPWRLVWRHALPAARPHVLAFAASTLATAALVEAALGFLGLGLPPPVASWGELLAEAHQSGLPWHLALPAGAMVTAAALCALRISDALAGRARTV